MVNKKFIVISYCCTFLLVYLCAITYTIIPAYLNKGFNMDISPPKTAFTTTTVNAVSEIPFSNMTFLIVGLIVLIIISALSAIRTMAFAY